MDRLEAMRVFVAVASEGSFTRAAEYLELSPQLVSKYVAQLEEHLDARLLNRTTRRVSLTEAGARCLQHAQQILADMQDLEHQMGDFGQAASGTLRINAPVSFAIKHLAKPIHEFQTQYPQVDVDIQLNDRKVDIVEEGYDIALRIGQLKNSSLIAKRIAPVRLVLCAAPSYLQAYGTPQHPEELQKHRYLRYSYLDNESLQTPYHGLSNRPGEKRGEFVCNNGDLLVSAAIEGAGIALQPTFICGDALADGRLVRIMDAYEPAPLALYAVYAHRKLLASKVRSFLDFIDGYFGHPPYWDHFDRADNK